MKYTKKPVTIEAVLLKEGGAFDNFATSTGFEKVYTMNPDGSLTIPTLEGDMIARSGDYIIKGVNGEFYPCKPDIFEKTYSVAKDETDLLSVEATVFPSEELTISVRKDEDYNGAHEYHFRECMGFNNGKTEYVESTQKIRFVQKNVDGSMTPGLQSEQIVLALVDRQKKLNAKFPSAQNHKALMGLELFLEAQKERVQDRISRGVMGDLKK